MSTFDRIRRRLRLPIIAAPMFLVSGPELVLAACRAGVIGAFPTANARTSAQLGEWLGRIRSGLAPTDAPVAANLIVHKSNPRLADDLGVLQELPTDLVITSVGSPAPVIEALRLTRTLVFADVASLRHARRAVEAGADGLILLTAGAGGQTGWANPFAFVRAVREFYAGPVVLAGGIADGVALRAALALGADLAYLGTKFLATTESLAPAAHKEMVAATTLDDVVLTSALTGLPTSMLRPSLDMAGPALDRHTGGADVGTLLAQADRAEPWRDLYSGGHTVSGVHAVCSVAEVVERTAREFHDQ
ncbi:NAD(P)H-dependent flavin oxidoreductase [Nocardia brasiliensis]|uniref:NAD(P)H-dependent flavin oxidoreductase n=1 Tax=Nocardia brasiliensis TaxID=37326 RepID=UPI0004A74F43|nr:nitronate monooxygenase [Nocardia brasiliensis]MBF6544513.1 nitronate monooxygenase [Nocardia brasiliensis]